MRSFHSGLGAFSSMGRLRFQAGELVPALSEVIGYKSGLALTRDHLLESFRDDPDHHEMLLASNEAIIVVRSEEFETMVAELLYRIGNTDSPESGPPLLALRFRESREYAALALDIQGMLVEELGKAFNRAVEQNAKSVDPTPFLERAKGKHGIVGGLIALRMIDDIGEFFHRNPWSRMRSIAWKDTKQLAELFESESLSTLYGKFFDQRFIYYLYRNFDDIDRINWRKFEGLAGEFFERSGFRVDMGPGRNDGSIDIRVWPRESDAALPPVILVQCKRVKKKVDKVVVKALWADMQDEGAESGLIVTSMALSPGAERVCRARNYPIKQADRTALRKWIKVMRNPGSGVFLGE